MKTPSLCSLARGNALGNRCAGPALLSVEANADVGAMERRIDNFGDEASLKFLPPGRLVVVPTPGDHHCLFHALGHLARHHNHPKSHLFFDERRNEVKVVRLRDHICYVLDRDWDALATDHPELALANKREYLKDMRSNRWGGEPEIDAALRVFEGVNIAVWSNEMPNRPPVLHSIFKTDEPSDRGVVTWPVHAERTHFSWMRKPAVPSTARKGPPPTPLSTPSYLEVRDAASSRRRRENPRGGGNLDDMLADVRQRMERKYRLSQTGA